MTLVWYDHDLLVAWLGDGQPPERPGWVANPITRHALVGSTVILGGRALMAGR